jgi:hypothetical protein
MRGNRAFGALGALKRRARAHNSTLMRGKRRFGVSNARKSAQKQRRSAPRAQKARKKREFRNSRPLRVHENRAIFSSCRFGSPIFESVEPTPLTIDLSRPLYFMCFELRTSDSRPSDSGSRLWVLGFRYWDLGLGLGL